MRTIAHWPDPVTGTLHEASTEHDQHVSRTTWGEGADMHEITGRGLATKRWRERVKDARCEICGEPCPPAHPVRRYCGDACAERARKKRDDGRER